MTSRLTAAVIASIMLGLVGAAGARAQTAPVVGTYTAGWNMAGAPPGTSLSPATTIYSWNGMAYQTQGPATAVCQGYYAYFADPATVTLSATATGPAQSCPLTAGWNLIGNPFAGSAVLPAGLTGYWWNPDRGAYDVVSAIPPGGAAWIYASAAGAVTLTYAPIVTRVPLLLGISFLGGGPYTVHVGDSIKLELPAATPQTATTNPVYLHLEASGTTGDISCYGGNCSVSLVNQYWTWHAIAPGTTSILVTPLCGAGRACPAATPIVITILP
ncbi:MAG TPA: hypothetical protein VKX16_16215 [Chloroflexota bacterium]|nr:hypothetical protein [Chloroflexota bacterium]